MTENQQNCNNKSIEVEKSGLLYKLNLNDKTAGVIGYKNEHYDNIIIPRTILHESMEYTVTSIMKFAFKNSKEIKSIGFPADSEIRTFEDEAFKNSKIESIAIPIHLKRIGKNSFNSCSKLNKFEIPSNSELEIIDDRALSSTSIEEITIPPHVKTIGDCAFFLCTELRNVEIQIDSELQSIGNRAFQGTLIESITISSNLIELKKEWCCSTENLKEIKVSSRNPFYKSYEDKFILKKSSLDAEIYDILMFAVRDIKIATIPSFVKIIGPYAFHECYQIQEFVIPTDSKLEKIESWAFSDSSIKNFTIPSSVKIIGERAFQSCEQLQRIEIPDDSELQFIESYALSDSTIECINIPSKLKDLKNGWCDKTPNLNKISVHPSNKNYTLYEDKFILYRFIDTAYWNHLVFYVRNIENVIIPNFIRNIETYAFNGCNNLRYVSFQKISRLVIIEDDAFSYSSIEKIELPFNLTTIKRYAFMFCDKLRKIDIPENSMLETIEEHAFDCCAITCFSFPSGITKVDEVIFEGCEYLQIIEFDDNSKLNEIDLSLFPNDENIIIMIAPNVSAHLHL